MDRIHVISSNINSIGYDQQAGVLELEFISGEIYQYYNVSENIYNALMRAPSLGQFLTDNIKYNYRYQKIR